MPPLRPKQTIPAPAPTAPSLTSSAPAAATARPASAASTWTVRASFSQLSSHSPTTGITTSSTPTAGVGLDGRGDRTVEDASDRHRRREVDGRLEQPPLRDLQEAGQLARAVQHRGAGPHRLAEETVGPAGQDRGDTGAGHTAAHRRLRLVAPHRDVTDGHTRDVADRVARPGLEHGRFADRGRADGSRGELTGRG